MKSITVERDKYSLLLSEEPCHMVIGGKYILGQTYLIKCKGMPNKEAKCTHTFSAIGNMSAFISI